MKLYKVRMIGWSPHYYIAAESVNDIERIGKQHIGISSDDVIVESLELIDGDLLMEKSQGCIFDKKYIK